MSDENKNREEYNADRVVIPAGVEVKETVLNTTLGPAMILAQDATTTPTIRRERKANKAWSADLMARCKAFAEALAKSVVGAQPGKKPFAVYLKRDTGKPNLPNRESADAIIGCTIYHLRAMKSPAIVLQTVQLPEDGFGVFARKPNVKRRRTYASDASF